MMVGSALHVVKRVSLHYSAQTVEQKNQLKTRDGIVLHVEK